MEIWEQTDERRIAAAQTRWAAEFERRHTLDGGLRPRCCIHIHAGEAHAARTCERDIEARCGAAA
jgi:hypothetical protein